MYTLSLSLSLSVCLSLTHAHIVLCVCVCVFTHTHTHTHTQTHTHTHTHVNIYNMQRWSKCEPRFVVIWAHNNIIYVCTYIKVEQMRGKRRWDFYIYTTCNTHTHTHVYIYEGGANARQGSWGLGRSVRKRSWRASGQEQGRRRVGCLPRPSPTLGQSGLFYLNTRSLLHIY